MSKQERATRTRDALLQAAATLFDRHGYTRTTLDQISARAGVSRGALHFHFPTKTDLARAIEQAAAHTLHHTAHPPIPHHVNALQHLMNLTHRLNHLLHHDPITRAAFRLTHDPGPHAHDLRHQWHTHVHRLTAQAAQEDALTPRTTPEALASTVIATTTGLELLHHTHPHTLTPGPLTHFWQLLLPTITHPHALPTLHPNGTPTPAPTATT
ncbi:ScbR family autoregulator-binding transcription factor [Streptomyces sp. NPDC029674]|uniref:ScbR family autoregulator-binding transcription factor n=1 Tax=Streptomyces sp. NPDC029674 TaxID=3365297 RepID=UPI00384BD3A2